MVKKNLASLIKNRIYDGESIKRIAIEQSVSEALVLLYATGSRPVQKGKNLGDRHIEYIKSALEEGIDPVDIADVLRVNLEMLTPYLKEVSPRNGLNSDYSNSNTPQKIVLGDSLKLDPTSITSPRDKSLNSEANRLTSFGEVYKKFGVLELLIPPYESGNYDIILSIVGRNTSDKKGVPLEATSVMFHLASSLSQSLETCIAEVNESNPELSIQLKGPIDGMLKTTKSLLDILSNKLSEEE